MLSSTAGFLLSPMLIAKMLPCLGFKCDRDYYLHTLNSKVHTLSISYNSNGSGNVIILKRWGLFLPSLSLNTWVAPSGTGSSSRPGSLSAMSSVFPFHFSFTRCVISVSSLLLRVRAPKPVEPGWSKTAFSPRLAFLPISH